MVTLQIFNACVVGSQQDQRNQTLRAGIILTWSEGIYFLTRTASYYISNTTIPLKAKFELVICKHPKV